MSRIKILICNVPLRSEAFKTTYPPLGALAVIQSLRKSGFDAVFYDINVFRYPEEEIRSYMSENKFDIIGISATVSTSYGFVKRIASIIRSVSPNTAIIVGGALTASAEILLKFTDVDFCVIGEGERTIVNLADYIVLNGREKVEEGLLKIKGICFLNFKGEPVFTGYERQIPAEEIEDADYGIIETHSRIDNYIINPFYYEQFKYDRRSFEEGRIDKKLATVVASRGCVNRCTFCHRWQKGIRIFPVDRVVEYIKLLKDKYNIGFISFGDEDFGASRKWLEEFIEKIKPLDILYRISGICIDNIDLATLTRLRESGCVAVHYGFESGSDNILKVMEKRADRQSNIKVAKWTHEAGLQTVYALVVGMPGESYETIEDTTDFAKKVTEFLPRDPIISINALVVLPGAPVYEYARYRGLLGETLRQEEEYLLRISDRGGDSTKQLNLTDYPYFIVQGWIRCIYWATNHNYYVKNKLPLMDTRTLIIRLFQAAFTRRKPAKGFSDSLFSHPLFYHLRYLVSPLLIMYINFREDKKLFASRCFELLIAPLRQKKFRGYISLRDFLKKNLGSVGPADIRVLRLGR